MNHVVLPLVVGLAEGMVLVLVAVGLTMTFGTMRILNMAHGGIFMTGGYLLYAFTTTWLTSLWGLGLGILLATGATTVLAGVLEWVFYRRFYGKEGMSSLLGTFALMLAFAGAVQVIWGSDPRSVHLPGKVLSGATDVMGVAVPKYDIALIIVALLLAVVLALVLYRSPIGRAARAVAMDRQMAAALGLNVKRIFQVTFLIGSALAAVAGALLAPQIQLESDLGANYVILAFALVLIGGLGSVLGTVIAGIGLGLVDAFVATYVPRFGGYDIYLLLLVVLVVRPNGLFGSASEVQL
jgi:branched-subunit amino acid ABC-type transport system permease component